MRMMNSTTLPTTLAQRVQALREQRGFTVAMAAKLALMEEDELRDIEQGITLFMAPHTRQKLAKVLRVKPHVLEDVEKPPLSNASGLALKQFSAVEQLHFLQTLLNAPAIDYTPCPRCDDIAQVQRFERQDIHGLTVHAIKVRCPRCWLKLDHG
jgi:transcriptional regulator with XRE-family HTH domain